MSSAHESADTNSGHPHQADPEEIARFEASSAHWWDTDGEFRALHDINPVRAEYVDRMSAGVAGKTLLDMGCGGGLFAEAMAGRGARVTGADLSPGALAAAREHATQSQMHQITYREISARDLAAEVQADPEHPGFDVVTCLEMLEHVPQPEQILQALASLLRPGGTLVLSTLNRHPVAFIGAILGAEYLTRLVPPGTHHYRRFLRPSELARAARQAHLEVRDIRGIGYNPFARHARLSRDTRINYLMTFHKEA